VPVSEQQVKVHPIDAAYGWSVVVGRVKVGVEQFGDFFVL
jgi:hypothetical protein